VSFDCGEELGGIHRLHEVVFKSCIATSPVIVLLSVPRERDEANGQELP